MKSTLKLLNGYLESTYGVMVGENRIGMVFKHTNPLVAEGREYYTANLTGNMITDLQNSRGSTISYTLSEAQDAVELAYDRIH